MMIQPIKQPIKRLSKHPIIHHVLAWLGASYIRLVLATSRICLHIDAASQPYFDGEENALYLLWHNRIALINCSIPKKRILSAMVSNHRDGRMIGDILSHFGVHAVHGSTSKGGATALKNLVRVFRAGNNICITPDGPRGPAHIMSEGAAQLAMLTDAPVICVSYAATRFKCLRSWDTFIVPLPFCSIHFVAAAPFHYTEDKTITKDANRFMLRDTLQARLQNVTAEADALAHRHKAKR
jgi:lysophospholipid acyltransferase (LPLAT)-like uncharacterized protein